MLRNARPAALVAAALLAGCQGAPAPEAPVAAGPVRFVQQPSPAAEIRETAQGVLTLDGQGCLRVNGRALVWSPDAALDISRPGVVRVFDRAGDSAVRVGEPVALLVAPVAGTPESLCGGPGWTVARFMPAGAA